MPTYVFKDGAHVKGLTAQELGDEFESIEEKTGGLTPTAVVDSARAKRSKLHDQFIWDDHLAAEVQRAARAGDLLRSIKINWVDPARPKMTPISIRGFVNIEPDEGHGTYVTIGRAMNDADLRGQVVERALAEAKAWQERYRAYKELASIHEAIDAASGSVARRAKVQKAVDLPRISGNML
jgi:hypothetical protein